MNGNGMESDTIFENRYLPKLMDSARSKKESQRLSMPFYTLRLVIPKNRKMGSLYGMLFTITSHFRVCSPKQNARIEELSQ
ncbi:hypothetical protein CW304_29810 [Bacillus sp. UFRGS-B20]|nr:hypothetical protein CW304_29810 [Bacillus sp. UFRGS-B20]